ncbi:MAG: DUF11 domain-containing protein [Chloroflexi bacterium]|nr:DUF11 domain-containing protein [Chloroflexota bacterium]
MKTRAARSEKGIALVAVLAFMVLALPLVMAALAFASTLSLDSGVKTRILKRQYALLGASQHAIYRVAYEPGYMDGLEAGVPAIYSLDLNGETVTVTIEKMVDPPEAPPPPNTDSSRRLQTYKEVTPTSASPGVYTVFTYTIIVRNQDDEPEKVTKVHDGLPPGFTYLAGSTTGETTNDPAITTHDDGSGVYQELVWNLSPLHITLQPGQQATVAFQAGATPVQGNYCNRAWAEPGDDLTSTGLTARIAVGSPSAALCPGEAATVTKTVQPRVVAGGVPTTFTYAIAINNIGTQDVGVSQIRDLLPLNFSYATGSTAGDITTADPTTMLFQGSQRLDWNFSPSVMVLAGQARTLAFHAQAQVDPGDYWNQAWVTFDELDYSVYTWPTALVRVMGVVKSSVTDGEATADSEVWVGSDAYSLAWWNLRR